MKPTSPVIPHSSLPEVTFAKNQPEYEDLPAIHYGGAQGIVLSRWHLNWRERLRALIFGDVYLYHLTMGQPLQPVMLQTERPEVVKADG